MIEPALSQSVLLRESPTYMTKYAYNLNYSGRSMAATKPQSIAQSEYMYFRPSAFRCVQTKSELG